MKLLLILFLDYWNDLSRFRRWSAFGKRRSGDPRFAQAALMLSAHGVEKGLSLASFEPRRGLAKLRATQSKAAEHLAQGRSKEDAAYTMARDAVNSYLKIHADLGIEATDIAPPESHDRPLDQVDSWQSLRGPEDLTIDDSARAGLIRGIQTRSSIRDYAQTPISETEIAEVVNIASATPSVCNRQGVRVHATTDPSVIKAALGYQNGNRSFGEAVPGLFIVTTDLTIFANSSERNQAFIDGGLFSMTLMLALHAHGFGSCPLNWSASYRQDRALRAAVTIPEHEVVIMMISFGKLTADYKAAGSRRYPIDHVLKSLECKTK